MERKPKMAGRLRARGVAALLALVFAAPIAFASSSDRNPPPPPVVTSPTPNSRLPDPKIVTIKGLGTSLGNVRLRVDVSHVSNGKRVDARRGNNRGNLGVPVPSDGKEWKVDMELPKMDRGWVDVRYTITAQQYWNKERSQHHISDAGSTEVTFDVFPQAQPEPLPVAPPPPVIHTPTSGTLLKREPNIHITGTGTPGNRVHVATRLFYALESNPGYEHKNNGSSTTVDVDKSGKWQVHLGYGGFTEPGYVNARARIVAKEIHREKDSLVSHETIREVPVEVPAKRAPTQAEIRQAAIASAMPADKMAEIQRREVMTSGVREALLRPMARITAPADNSSVGETLNVSGTAAPGSNLQVSVKRKLRPASRAGGKPMPSRGGSAEDLGTFTARADSKGVWKIRPVTLPTVRDSANAPAIEITVVELFAGGKQSTPHTVTVKQGR